MQAPMLKIFPLVVLFLSLDAEPAFPAPYRPITDSRAEREDRRSAIPGGLDGRHMELIGRWGHGPCYSVASQGDTVVFGSGGCVEIYDVSDAYNPIEIGNATIAGVPRRICFSGGYAYAACYLSGLIIIDLSNPSLPVGVGSWNEGYYVHSVAQAGDYAYVTDEFGLHIIDVSVPTAPNRIGALYLPSINMDIAVSGDYAYLACDEVGLVIIDVADPANPHVEGNYDTIGWSRGVAVAGGYAYVADYDGGLRVIDIGNPSSPFEVGSCITGGSAQAVSVSGSYAFVAIGTSGLRVVDISNPASPASAGYRDSNDYACDVAVSGARVFLAERREGLGVYDATDPASLGEIWRHDKGGRAVAVAVSGTYAYVADFEKALRILDVTDPSNPQQVGYCGLNYAANDVAVQGDYAYVGTDYDGLRIIDIGDPALPVKIGQFDTGGGGNSVAVSGTLAYVADNTDGLRVINVADPAHPVGIGRCDIYWAEDVAVIGGYAYVVNGWGGGLHVVDVSNPANPIEVGRCDLYDALGIAVSGEYAYVADGDTFRVIDVSNPNDPRRLGRCNSVPRFDYMDIAMHGALAFVAGSSYGVRIMDVSDPSAPHEIGYYDTGNEASGITLSADDHVYVADEDDGIYILYSPLVPTLLQGFSVSVERGAAVVEWTLTEEIPVDRISIARKAPPDDRYMILPSPEIIKESKTYRFRDLDCAPGAAYRYRVYIKEEGGEHLLVETDALTIPRASLTLRQNYPNPFNPMTTIEYILPEQARVKIEIYDIAGRRIACVVDDDQEAGFHTVRWYGIDASGTPVGSGIYLCRLAAGKQTISRKMLICR